MRWRVIILKIRYSNKNEILKKRKKTILKIKKNILKKTHSAYNMLH